MKTEGKTSNITHGIVQHLGRAIVSGAYEQQPFPIEAELCAQFDASRSIVREAVKMLTAKGLLSSRPRHGTRVEPDSRWNFLDPDVLRWLLERGFNLDLLSQFTAFRTAIEPEAAVLAARLATSKDKARIRNAIKSMEAAERGDGDPLLSDIEFHLAVLHASNNRFMVQCSDLVETALRFSIQLTNKRKGVRVADVAAHRAIADGIIVGDAAKAKAATLSLLAEVSQLIERARQAELKESKRKVAQ